MNQATINGIQQVGIGVKDAKQAWAWYRKAFKMDVPIFQDSAEAKLMTCYTSGKVESRHAILALNMQGGGGFEIWQYTSKEPLKSEVELTWKDLGILAVKMRCHDIHKTHAHLKSVGADMLGEPVKNPLGIWHFYVKDPFGNLFELIENDSWFSKNKDLTGGVLGVVIGVSSIDDALPVYQKHLMQTEMLCDKTGVWEDFSQVGEGATEYRRVILQGSSVMTGAFGRLFCQTQIELIETKNQPRNRAFEDRNWGDLGFIHVCFDVNGMSDIKEKLAKEGIMLTVDSGSEFDMGKAAGRFSYLEDPDGTWIEMVETFKVPIMEKLGWYLNLDKRDNTKNLPNFIVKLLSLNRVKA